MPILDLGYRTWDGERSPRWSRLLAITSTGLQLVWRAVWLRRLLMLAWLPAIPTGLGFLLYEQTIDHHSVRQMMAQILYEFLEQPHLAAQLMEDPEVARHGMWAVVLLTFFRYPQAMMIVILFGLAAPRMISYDMRSRAHLIYFSRPLTVAEYLVGKALVLVVLLFATTTLPALGVYVIGLMLSPDASIILDTYDLPLRILVASAALAIPTAALAILYSSFTSESRFAAFAWFATWALGWVTYVSLTSSEMLQQGTIMAVSPRIHLVSPYHVLGKMQEAIFGVLDDPYEALPATLLVAVVTLLAIVVSYHRVAAQIKI